MPGGKASTGESAGRAAVEFPHPQPGRSQLDLGQHAQLEAVVLAFLRPGLIQLRRVFELGDRVALGAGDLQEGRASQVGLARPGEPELAAELQQVILVPPVAGVAGLADRVAGHVGIAHSGRCPAVLEVKLRGVRAGVQVTQAASGKVAGLPGTVMPVRDSGEISPELGHERLVVDRDRVRPPGADQLLGRVRVTEVIGGRRHQAVQAAQQQVQVRLVAWPQPPVKRRVHPVPDPSHVLEQPEGLAGHVVTRQPDHVAAQLLQGGVPDVALLGLLGALAPVVRGHLHLSSDQGTARNDLLEPTVGDRWRSW